jgi:hypothetical protein
MSESGESACSHTKDTSVEAATLHSDSDHDSDIPMMDEELRLQAIGLDLVSAHQDTGMRADLSVQLRDEIEESLENQALLKEQAARDTLSTQHLAVAASMPAFYMWTSKDTIGSGFDAIDARSIVRADFDATRHETYWTATG